MTVSAITLPPAFDSDWEPTIREVAEKLKPLVAEWNTSTGGYDECYCENCFVRWLLLFRKDEELAISLGMVGARLLNHLAETECGEMAVAQEAKL